MKFKWVFLALRRAECVYFSSFYVYFSAGEVSLGLSTDQSVSIGVGGGAVNVTRVEKASGPVTGTWDISFNGTTLKSKSRKYK